MLIKVDMKKPDLEKMNGLEINRLISEVTRASYKGFHKVMFPYQLANHLLVSEHLDKSTKDFIKKCKYKNYNIGAEFDVAPLKLNIVYNDDPDFLETCNQGWRLGHKVVLNGVSLDQSLLVVEDTRTDGKFYPMMLENERKRIGFGPIDFELAQGGGSSGAVHEFVRFAKGKRFVFGIFDLDSIVPAQNLKLREISDELEGQKYVGLAVSTPCHEVENILPPSIVKQAGNYNNSADSKSILELMKENGCVGEIDEIWLHFDIEKGIIGSEGEKGKSGIKGLQEILADAGMKNWFFMNYQINNEAELANLKYNGFGKGVIRKFLESEKLQQDFREFMYSEDWVRYFSEWVKNLLWFFKADKPDRVYGART